MTHDPTDNRRPLASRNLALTRRVVASLLRTPVTPDQISAAGIGFAALAGFALLQAGPAPAPLRLAPDASALAFLLAAAFIQLRLLTNLLDGLVAVECGRGSPLGPLWNEMPDRLEDTLIIAGFGYAAGLPLLGVWTALVAALAAYTRVLGGALGQKQGFAGPMAKQHRMAALTLGCLLGAAELIAGHAPVLPTLVLYVVFAGTLVTIARRTAIIARGLSGDR